MEDTHNNSVDDIANAVLRSIIPKRGKKIRTILDPLLEDLGLPKVTAKELRQIKSRKNK